MHVWYLAYGSNLDRARFMRYLAGSTVEGGARDSAAPTEDRWVELSFRLTFFGESTKWNGGGVAFVVPDRSARAWFRAWRITAEQFEDVFAQENRLPVGTPLPWAELTDLEPGVSLDVGDRWYRRIHAIDSAAAGLSPDDGLALTFSCAAPGEFNPPSDQYRATIASGLATNPYLDEAAASQYLHTRVRPRSS